MGIPRRVPVPDAWHFCCQLCGLHPNWLLRLRHHLQVRCWHCDLPDHLREVPQGRAARPPAQVRDTAHFRFAKLCVEVRTRLHNFLGDISCPLWLNLVELACIWIDMS